MRMFGLFTLLFFLVASGKLEKELLVMGTPQPLAPISCLLHNTLKFRVLVPLYLPLHRLTIASHIA